ncbi:hypothetical protein GOP47_0023870 [Adiantum capillus-veneris]|uniref:Protein kinase domain-containing protein n=1 Tax=Adiantum capillus-veneris TaxID=13818 RepID=A0A9D4U5C1_ADICA|nr:hypothetical protein GOP47_0023870 [Adiantum capillus-veneris]
MQNFVLLDIPVTSKPFGWRIHEWCPSQEDSTHLSNAFTTIDSSNPSEGCRRQVALECGQVSSQSLVEIKNVAFMSMLVLFELTWEENTMSLDDCKVACSSNCSCTGFFYHTHSSFCLPFGDNTPLSNVSFISLPSKEHIAYIKIQSAAAKSKIRPPIVAAAVILPVIAFSLIVLAVFWNWKHNVDPELKLAEQELRDVLPMRLERYSYRELGQFTQGFSREIGHGGFGTVYDGTLPDVSRVAVKKLKPFSQGQKEFLAEIEAIGGKEHVNIVKLYGFCLEKQHRLLVYEYMENGSLDKRLFCKEGEQQLPAMSWQQRFNVALGTARGLAYLHEECPKPIFHFDVKPQNILLDGNLNAKLADFGLAKLVARDQSEIITAMRGTPGYIAPEWISRSAVSQKCDVYSFGMVLLELVSGRKNVWLDLMGNEEWCFPRWAAKTVKEGKVVDLINEWHDEAMASGFQDFSENGADASCEESIMEQVKTAVIVAFLCTHENPETRPSMKIVWGMLEGRTALPSEIPEVATIEMPAFKIGSSGSIETAQSSSFQC